MDKLNRKNLVIITAVLMAVIMVISLFVLRIGVSDNGMQYKLLEKLGLYDAYQTTGTGYYSDGFGIADKSFSKNSSGLIYDLTKQIFPVDGILYTTIPAVLYLLILICSGILIIFTLYSDKFKGMNITACLLFVLMFCDSAYIAYLNTPYKHGAFFVYALALCALFIYTVKEQKLWSLILFGIFACLFANATTISAVAAIIIGIFSIRLISVNKQILWKIVSAVLSVIIVVTGIISLPVDVENLYDSVFYGIALEDSSAMEKLGLKDELNVYKEVPSFDEKAQLFINSSEYTQEFTSKISFATIAGYYGRNLPLLYRGLKKVAFNATSIRTTYLSGFAPSSGKSGANTSFFTLYSAVKSKAIPATVIIFLAILIALIVVSLIYRNNYAKENYEKIISEFCGVFGFATIIIYPISYMLGGMTQIGFNMFYFNVMFDISLFMLIISTINLLMTKKNILKEKYGVNQ